MKVSKSKWFTVSKCIKCTHPITHEEKMYSLATCPYCGNRSKIMNTVMDTVEVATRRTTTSWWNTTFPFYHSYTTYEEKSSL